MRALPPTRVSRRALAPIKHARKCEVCKPSVAFDLHASGKTMPAIAELLWVRLAKPPKALNWVNTK